MTNDQYFKLEANVMADDCIKRLVEAHGMEGFGIYIALLLELRKHRYYRCTPVALRDLSRSYGIETNTLNSITGSFNLFKVKGTGEQMVITSPYLNRVMKRLEEKRKQRSEAGKKNASTAKRRDNGRFTIGDGTEEKSREEKSKTEQNREDTTVVVVDNPISSSLKSWEAYLNEALQDKAWLNLLGISSGLGKLFIEHTKEIIEAFREHVHLHGTGTGIQSTRDLKSYFASYLRPGSITQKRLQTELSRHKEKQQEDSPHRYEDVNPETGERTYFGNPIPTDAPPRPHNNAVWSTQLNQWI